MKSTSFMTEIFVITINTGHAFDRKGEDTVEKVNSFIARALAQKQKLLKCKLFKKAHRDADLMDNGDRKEVLDAIVESINEIVQCPHLRV